MSDHRIHRLGGRFDLKDWACLRKTRYTKQEAEVKAKEKGLRTYKCPYGQHWHVTHKLLH